MSDLISKQRAIKEIDRFIPVDPMKSDYTQGISVGLAIATRCIEEFSQENDDSSQGLVKDLISRQDVLHELEGCDYELKDWQRWKLKTMVRDIPSAEKTQLSATSVCKCPCVYREPCDYCHYDAYRKHGCPAEEGMKDE